MTQPIRTDPIRVYSLPWPEYDICDYCARQQRIDEKPWPAPGLCPACAKEH